MKTEAYLFDSLVSAKQLVSSLDTYTRYRGQIVAPRKHLSSAHSPLVSDKAHRHASKFQICPAVHWELGESLKMVSIDRNALPIVVKFKDDLGVSSHFE